METHIDLLETTQPLTQQKALDWMEEFGMYGETDEFQIGDTITFMGGLNSDIPYKSKIIGIDTDDSLYVIWDCYWFPINPKDKSRKIQKL